MPCGPNNLQRALTSCCSAEWQNLSFLSRFSPSFPSQHFAIMKPSEGGGWGGSPEDPFPSWCSPKTTQSNLICFCSTPESRASLNVLQLCRNRAPRRQLTVWFPSLVGSLDENAQVTLKILLSMTKICAYDTEKKHPEMSLYLNS